MNYKHLIISAAQNFFSINSHTVHPPACGDCFPSFFVNFQLTFVGDEQKNSPSKIPFEPFVEQHNYTKRNTTLNETLLILFV